MFHLVVVYWLFERTDGRCEDDGYRGLEWRAVESGLNVSFFCPSRDHEPFVTRHCDGEEWTVAHNPCLEGEVDRNLVYSALLEGFLKVDGRAKKEAVFIMFKIVRLKLL